MGIKRNHGHLSHKQPAVRLTKIKKFIKNLCEFLIALDSNQLWHKRLKQNQLLATGIF